MERSCKKLKITPILFNNGESLLSEFISFCPPIVRIKLFELYPTELMIIEEFDEIFKYNDIYYSFFGKKAYIGAQEATTEDLWFEFNQYEYGTRKPTSLREISNCFGQKLFIIMKHDFEELILTIIKEDQSVLIFGQLKKYSTKTCETTHSIVKKTKSIRFDIDKHQCLDQENLGFPKGLCLTQNQEVYYFSATRLKKLPIKDVTDIGLHSHPTFYFKMKGKNEPEQIKIFNLVENSSTPSYDDYWATNYAFEKKNVCFLNRTEDKKGIYYHRNSKDTMEFF